MVFCPMIALVCGTRNGAPESMQLLVSKSNKFYNSQSWKPTKLFVSVRNKQAECCSGAQSQELIGQMYPKKNHFRHQDNNSCSLDRTNGSIAHLMTSNFSHWENSQICCPNQCNRSVEPHALLSNGCCDAGVLLFEPGLQFCRSSVALFDSSSCCLETAVLLL